MSHTQAENDDIVKKKTEALAEYIVSTHMGWRNGKSDDPVEKTMLRCVHCLMQQHETLFQRMLKRIDITRENGYMAFFNVANELFEGEKSIVNWGRIVALYAFCGQLALYCKDKKMDDYAKQIAQFMGIYAAEVVTPFVIEEGGWCKLCEEFPPAEDDANNRSWKFLTLTAFGLGIAAVVSFLFSH
ncbi:bcl-2-like protein 1 [Oratosquilla oratoria]|uniref:bcl-2-like protein 1 n=1 Tax=Oratosquilla oratoria TaxID=337810 RepID=UPI003F75B7D7